MSKSTVLKPESTPDALGGVAKGQGWSSCSDYVGLGGQPRTCFQVLLLLLVLRPTLRITARGTRGPSFHSRVHCEKTNGRCRSHMGGPSQGPPQRKKETLSEIKKNHLLSNTLTKKLTSGQYRESHHFWTKKEWPICAVFHYPPLKMGIFVMIILLLLQHDEQIYTSYSCPHVPWGVPSDLRRTTHHPEILVVELDETWKCPSLGAGRWWGYVIQG